MNPVFIKVEKYKRIRGMMDKVKSGVEEAKAVLARLNELKEEEEAEFIKWKTEVEAISSKVAFIEEVLSEKEKEE